MKNSDKLYLLARMSILLWAVSFLQIQTARALPYTNVDVETAYEMITSDTYPNLVILDVRTQAEFLSGHIQNALLIPHTELEPRIGELSEHKNHEIIVYCRAGYRSAIACGILDAHLFTKVLNMLGGINAWIAAGYPVSSGSIPANVDINPDTLNLKSNGKWVTAYIELQGSYDVNNINVSTITCYNVCPCNAIHAEPQPVQLGDYDKDGVADLMVKFDRTVLTTILSAGKTTLTITGEVNGRTPFEGTDTLKAINK